MATLKVTNIKNESFNGDQLYLKTDGTVGIGTASPTNKVSLVGSDSGDTYLQIANSTTGSDANSGFLVGLKSDEGATLYQLENNYMRFGTNGTERLRITATGNLEQTIGASAVGFNQTAAGDHYIKNVVNSNRSSANGSILALHGHWNSKDVAAIKFRTGADTTNKDDAHICFETSSANNITERLRIDSSGRLLLGQTASYNVFATSKFQVSATDSEAAASITRWSANAFGPYLNFGKSRGGSTGSYTIVQDDDVLGTINFAVGDGVDLQSTGGKITCEVDGTPGANDTPGRLAFWTTPDGGYQPTERLRITSAGKIHSLNAVQSGGNSTSGFQFDAVDTSCVLGVQGKSAANGGSANNAVFQGWFGASNTFRVNCDGTILTSAGINFSGAQTNAAGMTSELLDSYEEGTWTPTIGGTTTNPSGGSSGWSNAIGKYTRVGRILHISFYLYNSSKDLSDGNGTIQLAGLPFTVKGGTHSGYPRIQMGYGEFADDHHEIPSGGAAHLASAGWQVNGTSTTALNAYGSHSQVWGSGAATWEISGNGCLEISV